MRSKNMRLSPFNLLLLASLTMTSGAAFASGFEEDMDLEEPEVHTFAAHVRSGLHSPRPASYVADQDRQDNRLFGAGADYLPPAGGVRCPIVEIDDHGLPIVHSAGEEEEEEEEEVRGSALPFNMDPLAEYFPSMVEKFMHFSLLDDDTLQMPQVFELVTLAPIQWTPEPPRLQLPEYPLGCFQFICIEERRVPEPSPYQDRQISWKLPADLQLGASLLREWFVTPHPRLALKAPAKTHSVTAEEVD